jgi:hypothetical protein
MAFCRQATRHAKGFKQKSRSLKDHEVNLCTVNIQWLSNSLTWWVCDVPTVSNCIVKTTIDRNAELVAFNDGEGKEQPDISPVNIATVL